MVSSVFRKIPAARLGTSKVMRAAALFSSMMLAQQATDLSYEATPGMQLSRNELAKEVT